MTAFLDHVLHMSMLLNFRSVDIHMHLLIFLQHDYKLLSPDVINSIISTEWPHPDTHPILFVMVKKFMIHGPCGALIQKHHA